MVLDRAYIWIEKQFISTITFKSYVFVKYMFRVLGLPFDGFSLTMYRVVQKSFYWNGMTFLTVNSLNHLVYTFFKSLNTELSRRIIMNKTNENADI